MAEALGFSAATKIVSSAVGLLCNKVYDGVTNRFKDGDVAKESVYEILVRDLNDIKSKLECLSLKDLDASYSFLKEGVQLLNLAIDSASKNENKSLPGEASRISKDSASDILKEASSLRKVIEGLSVSSKERFLSAKGRFKASREEATRAFNNKSLSTENRIMACKLRVAATILESGLEDPQVAVAACLVSLKELHGLPGIQDRFFVVLKGGFQAWLKTKERVEDIVSVLSIDHALFDFASKHSSEYPNVFTWPGIELKDRKVNPILHAAEILERIVSGKEFSPQLSRIVSPGKRWGYCFTVNSQSEVVRLGGDKISVIKNTGECKDVIFPETKKVMSAMERAIAVDNNDNVYALRFVQGRGGSSVKIKFVLDVFDENYNLKHAANLDFLHADVNQVVKLAADKNENIILIQKGDYHVYICNSKGQLKFQFERGSSQAYSLSITNNNDIMIPSDNRRNVHVYTTEGVLKSTIKTPQDHEIRRVAFHHGISKTIVLTYVEELEQLFLLCYSETGELENSEFLHDKCIVLCNIKSHTSGPFAVSYDAQLLGFIRL